MLDSLRQMEPYAGSHPVLRELEILSVITDIRDLYEEQFDRSWLGTVIGTMPIDSAVLRNIRHMTSITVFYPGAENAIFIGLHDLDVFVAELRRNLLPSVKERLRISPLYPLSRVRDRDVLIYRKLVAYCLPHNLNRLEELAQRLRTLVGRMFPRYPAFASFTAPAGAEAVDLEFTKAIG
jgi:hypothetical protein